MKIEFGKNDKVIIRMMSQKKIAVSTLNTIINALEFYYGEILKKHFIFEVKSTKKDKKLLVVLGEEEKDLRCLHKYKTQNHY